jgi:hypothetical protein
MTLNMGFWRSNSTLFILLFTINIKFVKAVHMSSFLAYLYYFHGVLYGSVSVPYLVCAVRKWTYLCYILLHVYVLCIFC